MYFIANLRGVEEYFYHPPLMYTDYLPPLIEAVFANGEPLPSDDLAAVMLGDQHLANQLVGNSNQYHAPHMGLNPAEDELYDALVGTAEALLDIKHHPNFNPLRNRPILMARLDAPTCLVVMVGDDTYAHFNYPAGAT